MSFKVVGRNEIEKPRGLFVFLSLVKPLHLSLSLMSISSALYYVGLDQINLPLIGSCITVILLHMAMNLLNDYNDHMSGLDIAHQYKGSRAIQKGWMRAIDVRNLSLLLFSLAVAIGLFVLLTGERTLLFYALAGLFSLFVFSKSTTNRPVVGLEEIVSFMLMGPILFHALLTTAGFGWNYSSLSLSVFIGMNASIYFHLSKWSSLFDDNKSNRKSTALKLGVDFSKLASQVSILLSIVPLALFIYFSESQVSHYVIIAVYGIFSVKCLFLIAKVQSSFSSKLREVKTQYLIHSHLVALLFLVGLLTQVLS